MLRKPLSWSLNQICTMVGKGTIKFDNPIQRPSEQWKVEDKSLLIHSILSMFVPDIYALQIPTERDGKKVNIYDILDGKQRLTTIYSFKNDEFALTKVLPVTLESTSETHDISFLKFSELHEDVQNELNGYILTLRVIELEEDDDEETVVDEIFYRLNNGKQVSRGHLAYISSPKNVQKFIRESIDNHELFKNVAHFADGSVKNSDRELSIMQSILLVGGYEWSTFNTKDVEKAMSDVEVSEKVLNKVRVSYDIITQAFNEHNKLINKTSIPTFINLIVNNDYNGKLITFLLDYAETNTKGDPYRRYVGAGGTKKIMVEGRNNGLQTLYDAFEG